VGHIQSEKASIVAMIIMITFLYAGEELLHLIGIDVNSFAVAGSFVLFFLALEMILGIRLYRDEEAKTASIVPIAFPLIAGAGTMTTLLSLKSQYHDVNIVIAILLNIILVYGVLKSSSKIEKMLGVTGLGIIRKVFGVILLAIAVKLFAANVKGLFI
jgi:multiple antibiotic resistance protein